MYNKSAGFYPGDKVIISCRKCSQKLRVPKDAGKISVTCPVCKTEFLFDPNDIVFKISYFLRNAADSAKRGVSGLKAYKGLLDRVLRSVNWRGRR